MGALRSKVTFFSSLSTQDTTGSRCAIGLLLNVAIIVKENMESKGSAFNKALEGGSA